MYCLHFPNGRVWRRLSTLRATRWKTKRQWTKVQLDTLKKKKKKFYSFTFFLTESVVKYWKRLSRVAVKSPFMEIFKAILDMVLSNLL